MNVLQNIKTRFADASNFGGFRNTKNIKYIVIHYTGNDGDTDTGNGNFFARNKNLKASAHYFVDDDSILLSVPENRIAYAVGSRRGYKHPVCRNSNSISIELCDNKRNNKIEPSDKTVKNALELTRHLMKKYNIPVKNVIRHYDVTGKLCPMYWCGSKEKDTLWLLEFKNKLTEPVEKDDLEVIEKINMIVNGKAKTVKRILKNGTNFISIRDIAEALDIEISNNKDIPVLKDKKVK